MCGGTRSFPTTPGSPRGLSPRVRGNPRARSLPGSAAGSIPACAGEPTPATWERAPLPVYPRVCGGTQRPMTRRCAQRGLSPRVRGNLRTVGLTPCGSRSIPACAGEPATGGWRSGPGGVYPRVCGGTNCIVGPMGPMTGLSPRVRGNQKVPARPTAFQGSIPACAGEPFRFPLEYPHCKVYPRVCGGTMLGTGDDRADYGLSPRVRGNPALRYVRVTGEGSIPACAGEP